MNKLGLARISRSAIQACDIRPPPTHDQLRKGKAWNNEKEEVRENHTNLGLSGPSASLCRASARRHATCSAEER